MTAESLDLFINNNKHLHDSVVHNVRMLRATVDRAAVSLARSNADWHDDPEADDHAEYHAPADVQFPRELRDQVVLDLVRYWLKETTIQESANANDH